MLDLINEEGPAPALWARVGPSLASGTSIGSAALGWHGALPALELGEEAL